MLRRSCGGSWDLFWQHGQVGGGDPESRGREGGDLSPREAQGTDSEDLLRIHSADPQALFQVHCCPPLCGQHETGDRLVHGKRVQLLVEGVAKEDWVNNLEAAAPHPDEREDELQALRRREKELAEMKAMEVKPGGEGKEGSSSSSKRKKKESKKERKRKKEKKEAKDKSRKEEREVDHDGRSPVASSQKSLREMYAGTGMDPRERIRLRVVRRAKKFASRKKDASSSSSSSSGSSQQTEEREGEQAHGLFGEASKARGIHERFPGVLFAESLRNMSENLLTSQGEDLRIEGLKAVAVLYYRQELQRKASAPQSRELLNLVTAIDLLTKGRPAQAGDVLTQRLKAVEMGLHGSHWAVTQKMEVAQSESSTIARRQEVHHAQRETHLDNKTKYLAGMGNTGKDEKGPKGRGKGKDQVKGKGDRDGKKGAKDQGKGQESK